MITVTLKDAKARLNELVNRAIHGEDVVLMKRSRHIATIIPITESDFELTPRLTDAQAARLWAQIRRERAEGRTRRFSSPEKAVAWLRRELKIPAHGRRRRRK